MNQSDVILYDDGNLRYIFWCALDTFFLQQYNYMNEEVTILPMPKEAFSKLVEIGARVQNNE